jgi:ABC-type sugar transport system ATPase subunit
MIVLVLLGGSGCGKTTTLQMIKGRNVVSGTVLLLEAPLMLPFLLVTALLDC